MAKLLDKVRPELVPIRGREAKAGTVVAFLTPEWSNSVESPRTPAGSKPLEPPAAAPKRKLHPVATWALCILLALALVGLVYALAYRPGSPPLDASGNPEPPTQSTNP
jgi:hypothetical protein